MKILLIILSLEIIILVNQFISVRKLLKNILNKNQ